MKQINCKNCGAGKSNSIKCEYCDTFWEKESAKLIGKPNKAISLCQTSVADISTVTAVSAAFGVDIIVDSQVEL